MPQRGDIALIVTGSVAAVKTFLLADALRAQGFAPRFIVTPAAWPFLRAEGKYAATPEQLKQLEDAADIEKSAAILIAPASADFIRQVALGDTGLGARIRSAGKPVFIAPAMNVMMWRHPAVQKNVKAVQALGMKMLGPALGDMACGDNGYGRMLEPADIARAAAQGADAPAPDEIHPLPSVIPKPCRRVLFVSQGPVPGALKDFDVQHAGAPGTVSGHYQLYPKDGMEHIWLPEDNDVVVMAASKALAAEMAKGAAESFAACIWLASKRPVIVLPEKDCDARDLAAIAAYGATVTDEKGLLPAIKNLERDQPPDFAGKKFLVLGGSPREVVDSFRFYANTARPEDHGARVARALEQRGARVMTMTTAGSARELVRACRDIAAMDFDAVIQLASISQLTAPHPAAHKISKTGQDRARLFEVEGNIDVLAELRAIFGPDRVMGYNNHQEWSAAPAAPFAPKIASLARRTSSPSPRPSGEGEKGGLRVIVTTGRTEERITADGAAITNAFTGRQGQEIARAFVRRGARVVVISGPVALPDVEGARTLHVTSMQEMHAAALREVETGADIYISAAAIADFSVAAPLALRLKPGQAHRLEMTENPSIVAAIARHAKRPGLVVSFAAQSPDTLLDYAVRKFEGTGADLTVANPIGPGADPLRNRVTFILRRDGKTAVEPLPDLPKEEAAEAIVRKILEIRTGA